MVQRGRLGRSIDEVEMQTLDAEADTDATATASKSVTFSENQNRNVNVKGSWSSGARSSSTVTASVTATATSTSTTMTVRRRPSNESIKESIALKPRVLGVFVPSLPVELWALIFGYSCAAYFNRPSASSSDDRETKNKSDNDSTWASAPAPASPSIPQHIRRAQYTARLRHADAISRVCRLWNLVVQEAMYEVVWIGSARQGRLVAERLGGDACLEGLRGGEVSTTVFAGGRGEKKRKMGWFGRVRGRSRMATKDSNIAQPSPVSASSLKSTSAPTISQVRSCNPGIHIRALHIETPSMERCSPHDLLLILQHCPRLETFVDARSVRRPMHPLVLSLSPVAPFAASRVQALETHTDSDLLTTDALLDTLLARPLKKLTWTNYEYDVMNHDGGHRFYEDVLARRLGAQGGVGEGLEELEVVVSGKSAFGMGSRNTSEERQWGVHFGDGGDEEEEELNQNGMGLSFVTHFESRVSALKLTQLTARYTTTTTTTRSFVSHSPTSSDIDGPTLTLPALRTLTVTLDNTTFAVLSTWSMPLLTALCITSADFGYRGNGFRAFFEMHGAKIKQLELGHSSADLGQEEAWVTQRPSDSSTATSSPQNEPPSIPLAAWCPNLSTFICSADAEWSWLSPDWIAPHVLLPAHPGLERIGVRGVERRVRSDWEDAERRAGGAYVYEVVDGVVRVGASSDAGVRNGGEDYPFFMLAEQFGSLLRREAFPSLARVCDMSWESDMIRKSGRLSPSMAFSDSCSLSLSPPLPSSPRMHWLPSSPPKKHSIKGVHAERVRRVERAQKRQIDRFWGGVLKSCEERGIRLENWRGEEVILAVQGEDSGCR
uniref:Uncharacterized protein n=1 Tax=Psilocybe cubensis TaxID=181762 RepID=A0A8H8CEC0_PSICU